MNALNASTGCSSHALANASAWSALPYATSANALRASPPFATADSISENVFAIAVPAASVFMPVDAMLDDRARISGTVMPTMVPIEPMRVAMSTIWSSVDAPLLPSRTSASAYLSYSSAVMWVMFASLPSDDAASSVLRFVATSRFDTVSENARRSSVATPSSPPIAIICIICSALVTCVLEKSIAACRSSLNCVSVPFTVLRMSRYAESGVYGAPSEHRDRGRQRRVKRHAGGLDG